MGNYFFEVDLPEWQSNAFQKMAALLPREVYNSGKEFMVPRLTAVGIHGVVPPLAVVKVFVNNLDQSPVPDIVADADGAWSSTIVLAPGANNILVQFYPPQISTEIANFLTPTSVSDIDLQHPTLFSRFALGGDVVMVNLDGIILYVGGTPGTSGLAKFDITTGIGVFLPYGSGPVQSGFTHYQDLDSNYVYSAHSTGVGAKVVARYNKLLTTQLNLAYPQIPNTLHSDGTYLYVVRDDGSISDIFISKVDPATMTLVGLETSIKAGPIYEIFERHNQMTDDGTHLLIPISKGYYNDAPGDTYYPGTPNLTDLIFEVSRYHQKVKKSDLTIADTLIMIGNWRSTPDLEAFKNSLVSFGGFYYSLVTGNPGRVIKSQVGVQYGLPALIPIDVTPLPFDTTLDINDPLAKVPRMKLGPDSRLYVVGNLGVARFTPGSSSIDYINTGHQTVDVQGGNVAFAHDDVPTEALEAPTSIFTDRSETFNVVAPAAPPSNLKMHYNETRNNVGLGWDPLSDGSAFIIEHAINDGAFGEVGREYFGNGFTLRGALFPAYHSGDTWHFRVRAFNSAGVSAPSAEAVWNVPYKTPPLGDCSNLSVLSVVGNDVSLQWDDGEIVPGGPINATTNRIHVLFVYRSTDNVNFSQAVAYVLFPDNGQPDMTQVGPYAYTYNPSTRSNTTVVFPDTNTGAYPYYYKVRAEQRDAPGISFPPLVYGPGAYSNTLFVESPPAAPSDLVMTNVFEGVLASWTSNSGGEEDGFELWRSTHPDNSGTATLISTVGAGVTSALDASAARGIRYYYKVRAFNGIGNSPYSALGTSNLPTSYGTSSIYFFPEIRMEATSRYRVLRSDGSYVYAAANDGSTGIKVFKIDLSDSQLVTSGVPYIAPSVGPLAIGSWLAGGFFYVLANGAGENARLLKINTSTLSLDSSVLLGEIGSRGSISSDGTYLYVTVCGTTTSIYKIDPSTMSVVTSSAIPSVVSGSLSSSVYMGGSIYAIYMTGGFGTGVISEINPTTLAVVNSSATFTAQISATFNAATLVQDGTHIYANFPTGASNSVKKFSVQPLTNVATVALAGTQASTSYGEGTVLIGTDLFVAAQIGPAAAIVKVTTALVQGTSRNLLDLDNIEYAIVDGSDIILTGNEGNSPPIGGRFMAKEDSTTI